MIKAEKYEEVESLKSIPADWSLWEMYKPTESKSGGKGYHESLQKVITLTDFKQFCEIWTYLPHGTPSKIFYDKEHQEIKKFKIAGKDDFRQIESICFFRNNIEPTWEDKRNEKGGTYSFTFQNTQLIDLDNLWLEICASLVTDEGINQSNHINGIRLCDKTRPPKAMDTMFKLEIWIDYDMIDTEQFKYHKMIEKDIKDLIKNCNLDGKTSYSANKKDN